MVSRRSRVRAPTSAWAFLASQSQMLTVLKSGRPQKSRLAGVHGLLAFLSRFPHGLAGFGDERGVCARPRLPLEPARSAGRLGASLARSRPGHLRVFDPFKFPS